MNSFCRFFAFLAISLALAACGSRPARTPANDEFSNAQIARIVTETATKVAVSKVGAKICRSIPVGISEHDLVRGTVVEVGADMLRIRIDDPGRFPEILEGVRLMAGTLVSDDPLKWTPCA